jgi:hypothetical protein
LTAILTISDITLAFIVDGCKLVGRTSWYEWNFQLRIFRQALEAGSGGIINARQTHYEPMNGSSQMPTQWYFTKHG